MTDQSTTSLPGVSLVIPVFERPDAILRCLRAVKALDYPPELIEVLVVDNGSRDGTPDVVREEGFEPLIETAKGAANARNKGIAAATREIVAFTDSDCEPLPDWLRELVRPFEDAKVGGVGGGILGAEPENVYEEYYERRHLLNQQDFMRGGSQFLLPFIATANAAYRREVLEAVEGFDPWFCVNAEDADLSWRVQWAGYELRYAADAALIHHHRSTFGGLARAFYSYGAGTVYLMKRHGKRLGRTSSITWPMYRMWLTSPLKLPLALISGSTPYDCILPWLDWIHATMHLAARWRYSFKLGVWCL